MMRGDTVQGLRTGARCYRASQERARFTELFESLQEGIYITTPDGVILDVNPALVACWATIPRKMSQETSSGDFR